MRDRMLKNLGILIGATALTMVASVGAWAQTTVKIGAIYPLSGNAASAVASAKAALEVAADIVITPTPNLVT